MDAPVANTTTDNPAGLPTSTPSLGSAQPGNPPVPAPPAAVNNATGVEGVAQPNLPTITIAGSA